MDTKTQVVQDEKYEVPTTTSATLGESEGSESWIDLFYDLFFAASLSAYANARKASDASDIVNLIAYFTIIWWTWCSQTLFDIRFRDKPKTEQVFKFFQLMLLIGYGVCSSKFSLYHTDLNSDSPSRTIDITGRRSGYTASVMIATIFILSRIQVAGQYLMVLRRKDWRRITPKSLIIIHTVLPLVSAALWTAGIFTQSLYAGEEQFEYLKTIFWLAGILFEAVCTVFLRLKEYRNFHGSHHLVNRLGSLTIIILGETAIKLVETLRDVLQGAGYTSLTGFTIFSSVFIYYLIFRLYFIDFNKHKVFAIMPAYSWAYCNYFLHLATILLSDGATSLLILSNVYSAIKTYLFSDNPYRLIKLTIAAGGSLYVNQIDGDNATCITQIGTLVLDYNNATDVLIHCDGRGLSDVEGTYVWVNLFSRVFELYKVVPSQELLRTFGEIDDSLESGMVPDDSFASILELSIKDFYTSAQTFVITGGLILLFMIPLMRLQGRLWPRSRARWLPIASRAFIGLAWMLLASLTISEALVNFMLSGWMLPAYMFSLVIVATIDVIVEALKL